MSSVKKGFNPPKPETSYKNIGEDALKRETDALRQKQNEQKINNADELAALMAAQADEIQQEEAKAQPQVAQAQPQVVQAQPQVAQAQPQAVQDEPQAVQDEPQVAQAQPQVVQDEPKEKTQEPIVELRAEVEKPKGAAKVKNSATTDAVTIENGEVQFHETFQTNQIKRSDFGGLNYAAPRDIIVEAKMRAIRDGLTILEVQNLLLAMYVESGLPTSLVKRYKKSAKKG